jgi:hypothetical protein
MWIRRIGGFHPALAGFNPPYADYYADYADSEIRMNAAVMITPQARRRITAAVRDLPDLGSRDRWGVWAKESLPDRICTDVPDDVAAIALEALIGAERGVEAQLAEDALDEDRQADLLNDLGYIRSIAAVLRSEGLVR